MKLIGLTGGIGSGKSTVAGLFSTLGIPVYESDSRAKFLMNNDPGLRQEIVALLGSESYTSPNEINRSWIASKVFNNPPLLSQLNGIVHPAVFQDLVDWIAMDTQQQAPYLIQESALLFEEDLAKRFRASILVVAPVDLRIDRVMKRDGIAREEVLRRIENQWPDDRKIPLSDFIIYNDGNRSLIEQVMDINKMIVQLPDTR